MPSHCIHSSLIRVWLYLIKIPYQSADLVALQPLQIMRWSNDDDLSQRSGWCGSLKAIRTAIAQFRTFVVCLVWLVVSSLCDQHIVCKFEARHSTVHILLICLDAPYISAEHGKAGLDMWLWCQCRVPLFCHVCYVIDDGSRGEEKEVTSYVHIVRCEKVTWKKELMLIFSRVWNVVVTHFPVVDGSCAAMITSNRYCLVDLSYNLD